MNVEDNGQEPNVDITDDLNEFEKDFYGKTSPSPTAEADEPVEEENEDQIADDLGEDDNPPATEDEDDDEASENDEPEGEDEEDEEPAPKAKKKRASVQERINELTADKHEERRMRLAAEAELARLRELANENKVQDKPKDVREMLPAGAPSPDAKDADGNPIYDLGEFDPQYIADLTRFTIQQETKAAREAEAQERQAAALREAQQQLADAWVERLDTYEAEVPEIREDIKELTDTFQSIEPMYGEYLATTIMSSEVGPQIMHYLSQNIGEAQKIVASGPAAATLALGRLEAKLTAATQREEKRNKKVTAAKEPPKDHSRGAQGRFSVPPDTDDLDAFEREFYKK